MLGAIIGDVVGSHMEFSPTDDYNFEWLSKDKNFFTEDTICTVAVADALLRGADFGESIYRWCKQYPLPLGCYDYNFSDWLMNKYPEPVDSDKNSAAMRVSPVAHWFEEQDKVLEVAAASAAVSHNNATAIKGAQTVALAIHLAMRYNRNGYLCAASHIDEIIDACVQFSGYDLTSCRDDPGYYFDDSTLGAVPLALKIISVSSCFEDAVRVAVNQCTDSDTLAAIVGSMAEAIWGIPLHLRYEIMEYLPAPMQKVITDFYTARPRSYKPLIDTVFSGVYWCILGWELLNEEERKELVIEDFSKIESMRMKMRERAERRENIVW